MAGIGGAERLAFLRGQGDVARRGGEAIGRAAFLAEIAALAERLPARPYVVNLCADRIRFAAGLAAAMLRGQITLLPGEGSAAAVAALLADYPALYALTDMPGEWPCPVVAYPTLDAGAEDRVPAFPPSQIAAVLFTSGSTGRPMPSARSWGRLVAGSRAAGAALGIARHAGAALVATVPHAHSYGLESAVMLALQHGLLLDATRPFFPADVAAALTPARPGEPPGVLVTAPVHLRALLAQASPAGLALSATAPLTAELAVAAEAAFAAPLFEIYGCSEAGQLAVRRTAQGPLWRCLDGFRLRQDAAGSWACGPDEADTLLADRIELTEAGFLLHGRGADQVNIAGKRSSLAYLTRQLTEIDGVTDGVFLLPADGEGGEDGPEVGHEVGRARLAALAVAPGLAPELAQAAILAALRARIDPAFLPRPLKIVDALPRDALGKLPRRELLRLAGFAAEPARPAAEPPIPPDTILLDIPAGHPAGPGHFPGNPVVPGAVLLDHLAAPLLAATGGMIEAAKFHHPVRPGERVAVGWTTQGDITRFEGRLAGSAQLVLSGSARPPSPPR